MANEIRYVNWDGLVYYDGKIKKHIDDLSSNYLRFAGSFSGEDLPDPTFETKNYVYKITNDFITNSDFVTPDVEYQAGTLVWVTDNEGVYLYDRFVAGSHTNFDDVLFDEPLIVTNPIGAFEINENVQNMSIKELFSKLLKLVSPPVKPDAPEGSSEIIEEIISTNAPIHSLDENGNLVETEFAYTIWTEAEGNVNTEGLCTFYQIVDSNNVVIESGYNEATDYYPATLTIALPEDVLEFEIKQFDTLSNCWRKVENFEMVKSSNQSVPGYTVWEVPEHYYQTPGATYRFVIIK